MKNKLKKLFLKHFTFPYLNLRMKQAVKIRDLLTTVMNYLVRYHDESYYIAGEDKHKDRILFISIDKVCGIEVDDFAIEFKNKYKNELENMYSYVSSLEEIREFNAMYFQIQSHIFQILMREEESRDFFQKAKKINRDSVELNFDDFDKIEKDLNRKLKFLRREIRDRKSDKINFKLQDVIGIFSIMLPLFIISGYLYNTFYLGSFGIDVPNYFALSDYLASSIDNIRFAATGALIALIGLFINFYDYSRKTKYEKKKGDKLEDFFRYLMIVIVIVSGTNAYFRGYSSFYYSLALLLYFASFKISTFISLKFFERAKSTLYSLSFLFSFFIYMFASIAVDIHIIKNEVAIEKIKKMDLHVDENLEINTARMIVLSANSKYFFLYDFDNKTTNIIPREKIDNIVILSSPTDAK